MKGWIDTGLHLATLCVLAAILWTQIEVADRIDEQLDAIKFDTDGTKFNTDQIIRRMLLWCAENDQCGLEDVLE